LKQKALDKLVKLDIEKGKFLQVDGDIDNRDQRKLDVTLHSGFKISCGLRGSKLSGG
jgi:hypothetical protein